MYVCMYVCMYRLSYERRGDISFIARETISYFITSERSEPIYHTLVPLSRANSTLTLTFLVID